MEESILLPHAVTFVCSLPNGFPDLFGHPEIETPEPDSLKSYLGSEVSWVLRTYLVLKRKQLNVSISARFIPDRICVVSPYRVRTRSYLIDSFVVGCRSDFARPEMCDVSIVQNQGNVKSETDIFIPHWPQPGLTPRLRERGTELENVAFKGRSFNLLPEFRSTDFLAELARLGVCLDVQDESRSPTTEWSDYSTCDIVLAVRDLTEQDAMVKPSSKLVNAWIAGVPAILGPEPAFRDLRKSPLDYFEVKTPGEALNAIRQLKSEPALYEQMVANGRTRALEFTEDVLAQKWIDALAGAIAEHYARWRRSAKLARLANFPIKVIRQKLANRAHNFHRDHGRRIVSGRHT
jgi:hypothetical protein